MALVEIRIDNNYLIVGDKRKKKLSADGCNEPFKDRFWCPRKKWFMTSPCPFINKIECGNYRSMCGSI